MAVKYFITGAHGFIGKTLCEYLLNEGAIVVKYDRVKNNMSDLLQCDIVIHLSAYGNHYHQTDINELYERNLLDLRAMLYLAKLSSSLKKFYNISSSSVTLPVQTLYSASKLIGEAFVNDLKDKRFINVRPYSVYGHGEADHRFIPTVIRHLKSGDKMTLATEPTHDWIHSHDFIKAMLNGYTEIGTGESFTNYEVVRMLEEISGKKLNFESKQLRSYDNLNWVCPNSVPHISLYEGLKLTYEQSE